MSDPTLTKTRMQSGIWYGLLTGAAEAPRLEVTHLETPVADVNVTPAHEEGEWLVQIPIPASCIGDGMQTILIADRATGKKLDHITLMAGEVLGDDLRAEVDLLRAELDMLKRAFRRHCVETE
ncbi:MAG: hypothetical protein V2I76_10400 [Roseobacter sp.]|jgi:hypothetical protein|nr:hypothetical protein [Roseobacter sp.]